MQTKSLATTNRISSVTPEKNEKLLTLGGVHFVTQVINVL